MPYLKFYNLCIVNSGVSATQCFIFLIFSKKNIHRKNYKHILKINFFTIDP